MNATFALLIALQLAPHAESAATAEARAAHPEPRRVLALYWYPYDHPVTVSFDRQVQAVFKRQAAGEIEYYAEYFESARFPGESQARIMRDYLREKYGDRRVDVLLTWGAVPLEFLLKYREELFTDTPIVCYLATLEAVKDFPRRALTGVLNPDAYEKTLDLALTLHPDATEAFIISGTPARDKLIEREAREQLEKFESRVKITYLTDLPLDRLIATVKNLPSRSVILYSRQSQEDPGGVLHPNDFLNLISRSASVPVYSPWKSHLGYGGVGGVTDDPDAGATKAAEMVLRVARGTRPEDIPTDVVPKVPMFDSRQLKRWGISEDPLPPGSVVLFGEPTLWSQYRYYIIGTGIALGVQTMLIAALLVQRLRRRRVENALRESEERFRLMADTAPVLVWRSGVDKAFDFFNLPWFEFRGRSLQEEAGSGWTQGVHPEDLDQCLATYSSAFDERRTFRMEYRLQRADGEYRWMLDAGVPRFGPDGAFLGYIGSCFDITDRRQALQALQESEKRYALATAAGSVGVWDWSLATNDIWIDPALKRALGYEDFEIVNRLDSWLNHVHPDDAGRLLMDAYAHINGMSPSFESEHRMLHKDGAIRWFLTRGSVVRLTDGSPVRIVGTDTDITERKSAEIRLEESRHELARVSRVTTLAQFAAAIAHEASQPLNTILLNARACLRWLKGPAPSADELRTTLQDIAEAAKQANEVMIRNRGMFSRHPVEKQLLDMNSLVHDVVALARTRLHKGRVHLETSLETDLPEVLGDHVELQQVLLNLLLNGIEAVEMADPPSRQIWVETSCSAGTHVQITVRDTGVGLQGVDTRNLFAPFYTTKPTGTGVGLSISRFIVEDHGGSLWAESGEASGATFTFTIAVAKPVVGDSQTDQVLQRQTIY